MGDPAMIKMILQGAQGFLGVMSAGSAANAAEQQAEAQVAELERQKEEERLNARSQRSDRAREADKHFASMITAMAETGGAGTGNVGRFAGEIGFVSGVDQARITGNSMARVSSLTSKQAAARAEARNAKTRAAGNMFSSILTAAGGITDTVGREREQKRQTKQQKNTAT